ncbi:MAG: FtsH protease activity modulator HflK [Phycisphaerae bacterium]
MTQDIVDLELAFRQYWRRYRKRIIAVPVIFAALWELQTTVYKVEADSEAVVLRLGKLADTVESGLHFKLPWPIDTVYTVPVERVQPLEFGYRTIMPARRTEYAVPDDGDKTMARMLTADLNLAHVEWVVLYRIKDPEDYLFNIGGDGTSAPDANARNLIGDVSEAVMRRVIGDVSVDSVITTGRDRIAAATKEEMQQMLDGYEAGIKIEAVKLQSATPPDPVKDAFDAVNRAKQNKERVVNDAKGERNRQIPAARGARDRAVAEAEGYALRVTKEAQGRSAAFTAKLAEYQKAPEITTKRLYLEAMEEILANVDDKIIVDESLSGILPLLDLGGAGGSRSALHTQTISKEVTDEGR